VIVPTRTLRRDFFILKNLLLAALVKPYFKKNLECLHLGKFFQYWMCFWWASSQIRLKSVLAVRLAQVLLLDPLRVSSSAISFPCISWWAGTQISLTAFGSASLIMSFLGSPIKHHHYFGPNWTFGMQLVSKNLQFKIPVNFPKIPATPNSTKKKSWIKLW
jgi:hypothetical protein